MSRVSAGVGLLPILAVGCQLIAGVTGPRELASPSEEGDASVRDDGAAAEASDEAASRRDARADVDASDPCARPDAGCTLPSCRGDPFLVSAARCGPGGNANCCDTVPVPTGSVNRINDPGAPATVSAFALDRYEVTVARFRQFMRAGAGAAQDAPPPPGAGAHPALAGSGWDPSWTVFLAADVTTLDAALTECSRTGLGTYGRNNDVLPMTCITWFEAFAFCAWDGGRLPTEAEWNYVAAGGAEQRAYPWSVPPTSSNVDSTRAAYCEQGVGTSPGDWRCTSTLFAPLPVGARPAGDGLWGHADLAGNAWEWTLDWYADTFPATSCVDCARIEDPGSRARVGRGGGYFTPSFMALNTYRWRFLPATREGTMGVRCARAR